MPKNGVNGLLFCFYGKCFEQLFFHKNHIYIFVHLNRRLERV